MNLKIRKIINVQHYTVEIILEKRLRWFGYLKRVGSDGILNMIAYWRGIPREGEEKRSLGNSK